MISEVLREIRNTLDQYPKDYKYNSSQLSEYDKQINNLQHELEFEEDYKARCSIATKFHSALKGRRSTKNFLYLLEPIYDLMNKYPTLINDINNTIGEIRKRENNLEGRVYHVRDVKVNIENKKSIDALLKEYHKDRKENLR